MKLNLPVKSFITILFWLTILVWTVLFCININFPLVGEHNFRITQTASTAFWFVQEGFRLDYQTPVVVKPWSIPFEFPIYQYLTALLSLLGGLSIEVSGRIISILSIIGTLCMAYKCIQLFFNKEDSIFITKVLTIIYLSMPCVLHFGRTVLIESTALFFTVAQLYYFLKIQQKQTSLSTYLSYLIFGCCAILQKSTTFLPILLVEAIITLYTIFKYNERIFSKRNIVLFTLSLLIVIVGFIWVKYSDSVKMNNDFGKRLTSEALKKWNFGSFEQKTNIKTYLLIFKRIFFENSGKGVGFFLLLITPFLVDNETRKKIILLLVIGALHFLIFTNLHWVHNYYQLSLFIYIACGYTLVIFSLFNKNNKIKIVALALFVAFISINYVRYFRYYDEDYSEKTAYQDTKYIIGHYIKENYSDDSEILAFGMDWNPAVAYHSQKKAFICADWFLNRINDGNSIEYYNKYFDSNKLVLIDVTNDKKHYKRLITNPSRDCRQIENAMICSLYLNN